MQQIAWLRRAHPDVLIDLRHTVLPLLWRPWRAWRYLRPVPSSIVHMRDRHLWRLRMQDPQAINGAERAPSLWIAPEDRAHAERLLKRWSVEASKPLVIICAGARSHT